MSLNVNNKYTQICRGGELNGNSTSPLNQNPNYITFSQNQNLNSDVYVNSSTTDGCDDGKISFKEGAKSFLKGLVSPITSMFSSPKNFLIGAGMMIGGAALIAATGGAAAPVLIAAGATMGGIQVAKGVIKASNAKTDAKAKEAWENVGSGTGIVAMSVAGAKSSLKAAGYSTEGLNPITATAKCFTTAPKNISTSVSAFTQGKAFSNIKGALGIKKCADKTNKPAQETPKETTPRQEIEVKPTQETEVIDKPKVEIEPKAKTEVVQESAQTACIEQTELPEGTPEYLYHMTSEECYKQILESKTMHGSIWEGELAEEAGSQNSMNGIYMVSRDNMCDKWMGAHFEEEMDIGDIGELLLLFTGKGDKNMVAIQIPTRSLNLSKLRFRPYIEASMDAIKMYENGGSALCREGLPLSELPKYIGTGPVEFVYQDNMPSSLFSGVFKSRTDLPFADILSNLFGKAK